MRHTTSPRRCRTRRERPTTRFRRDQGATMAFFAVCLPVIVLCMALVIDLGRQRGDRREMQATANVVALDMARLADGRSVADLQSGLNAQGDPVKGTAIHFAESAARNGIPVADLDLAYGFFDESTGDFATMATYSVAAGWVNTGAASAVPNAARVVATTDTAYLMLNGDGGAIRQAIAQNEPDPLAMFRHGSFGVSAEQVGLLNSLLAPIGGAPLGLDLLSYQGLAGANVTLFDIGTRLGLATPGEVLSTAVAYDDFLLAAADVLRNTGDANDAAAASVLETLALTADDVQIAVADIVDVDSESTDAALAAGLNVFDLVQSGAFLSRCTPALDPGLDPECSAIELPDLSAQLGVAAADLSLTVIESPRYVGYRVGDSGRTSQMTLGVDLDLANRSFGTCVPGLLGLNCLLSGILGLLGGSLDTLVGANINLSGEIRLARTTSTISDICPDPSQQRLDVASVTSLYDVDLRLTMDLQNRRGLLGSLLGNLVGGVTISISTNPVSVADSSTFIVPPDVLGETTNRVGRNDVGLQGLNIAVTAQGGQLSSLLNAVGNTVGAATNSLVNPLLTTLNPILANLVEALGLTLSGADITPIYIDCGAASLRLVG